VLVEGVRVNTVLGGIAEGCFNGWHVGGWNSRKSTGDPSPVRSLIDSNEQPSSILIRERTQRLREVFDRNCL
jgi:hypothetical protein